MFFNFNETSYKMGFWAVIVEALGGMVGALWFFSLGREGRSPKCLDWARLIKIELSVKI